MVARIWPCEPFVFGAGKQVATWEACSAHTAHQREGERVLGERERQLIHGRVNGSRKNIIMSRNKSFVRYVLNLCSYGFYFPVKAFHSRFKPGLPARQQVAPVSCKETGWRLKKPQRGRRASACGYRPMATWKQSQKFRWLWGTQQAGWDAVLGRLPVRKAAAGLSPLREVAGCSWQRRGAVILCPARHGNGQRDQRPF